MAGEHSLAPMLAATTVAVVGASERPGSFGEQLMLELERGWFSGEVFAVNPRYRTVLGRPCHPSLEALPGPVDLVLLAVPNAGLEQQLETAVAVGTRSAVIFATGHEAPRAGRPLLVDRLARIARAASVPVCGCDCMGFLNLEHGLRACGYPLPDDLAPGPIAFVSHSGSVFSAFAYNRRGLRFNLLVSPGRELVTPASAYIDYALELPTTRVVGLFLEAVRDAQSFRSSLHRAEEMDVPVIALKVGRSTRAREMVTSHSGALAGEDAAFEALFDAYGVTRVKSLNEMADTLELFATGRRPGPGGCASVHDSGGERALVVDEASAEGLEFASIGDDTRARMQDVLDEGLSATNPLDAWGTGNDYEDIYVACLRALLDDPAVAAVALSVDLTTELYPDGGYVRVAKQALADASKPVAVVANLSSAIDARDAAALRAAGVPVLESTRAGLAAFRHLFARRDHVPRDRTRVFEPAAHRTPQGLGREAVDEAGVLELLRAYGLDVVPHEPVDSLAEALRAARAIGYPVALKARVAGLAHKTAVGGVKLHLRGDSDVAAAYEDFVARFGPRALVARMAEPGIELALGLVRDDQFGPLVMVGAGGTGIELAGDRRFALPPIDPAASRRLIGRLRIAATLSAESVARAAEAVARFSVLAIDLTDDIQSLDVNPVIVSAARCTAVDALLEPRARPRRGDE